MLNVRQIQKTTFRSTRKRLQMFGALLLLFAQSLFAVNESGNLNVGNGQYASRATDITWTSGSISLSGGTLEIFGDFTINSGVNFNFNNNSTLIVHGNFTYSVGNFH
ncbi:MAG TPA: hypothetical protein PLQ09_01530, partial [Prolixibacteraceae bacterium]|nr:hypothetical protein [Prolixibacteraceae bacterium]